MYFCNLYYVKLIYRVPLIYILLKKHISNVCNYLDSKSKGTLFFCPHQFLDSSDASACCMSLKKKKNLVQDHLSYTNQTNKQLSSTEPSLGG